MDEVRGRLLARVAADVPDRGRRRARCRGRAAGLGEAHRRFGTLPWSVLLEPAIEHARNGVELNQPQGFLHEILDVILRHTDEGREHVRLRTATASSRATGW